MIAVDLPVQPTSFVGRTHELAEIIALLDNPDCRLITLLGPGGIGKTRLSLEVATLLRQRGASPDPTFPSNVFALSGVYFIPLQPINSPDFLLSALAEALSFQFYSGGDAQDELTDYLRPKSLLLILDNFEHLLDGVDLIADLLANAPKLKFLVTSRETLNLREEWLYPVRGMHFPEQEDAAEAESYSAVRLFLQSARRMRPDFSLTTDQAAVLRICRLVEGMPLALEMTAAWLRHLPAHDIAQQLERGLDILESPARNIPARHRSMRTVFEYSWNLLSEAEQAVFTKLSVFRGGFRREAAEAIAGATLGVLSALVDKSLLSVGPDGRYSLHELVRQYAEEKLNASPEARQHTHDTHCTYYMDFLTQRDEAIIIHESPVAIAEITAELENVRSAVDWALDHGFIESHNNALDCLTLFYQFRCLYAEGEEVTGRIVAALRRSPVSDLLGRMLIMHGWFIELRSQDYPRAITFLEEGSRITLKFGNLNCMEGLLRLSDVAVKQGNYERARELAQESADLARAGGELWTQTFDLAHLGYVHYLLGNYTEAKMLIQEAIRIAEKYESTTGLSDARNNLGLVELAVNACQDARQTFTENLAYSTRSSYLKGTVLALIGAGDAAKELGEYQESRRYLSQALMTALDSNQIPYVLSALTVTAILLVQTGNRERAAEIALLVLEHRAATHETKSRASQLVSQLEASLGPELLAAAVERARYSDIGQIVKTLLANDLSENPGPSTAPSANGPTGALTERELDILRLTAEGLSNREIAEQLFLAVGTVKWYLSEIYAKLYVTSRTQAIARAKELNLLT